MVKTIKNIMVSGVLKPDGKCPNPCCNHFIIVPDRDGYKYVRSNGIVEYDNGEQYIKCKKCGKFAMRPKLAV